MLKKIIIFLFALFIIFLIGDFVYWYNVPLPTMASTQQVRPVSPYYPTVSGAINPNVNQGNIHSTICVSGWTKTIRPKTSYTNNLKSQQMAKLGLKGKPSDYEEDHLVSLEIGGNPTDPNNLWPEPWTGPEGARKKDAIETKLKRMVCDGEITLSQAQVAIMTDWEAAYRKYIGPM